MANLPERGPGSFDWWQQQLQHSAEARDALKSERRDLVNRYRDKALPSRYGKDAIRVNVEFEKTEQKRHQLFFRLPTLRLKPTPRTIRDAAEPDPLTQEPRDVKKAVRIFREVLQHKAGPKGMNTKALLDQNLVDLMVPAGLAACIVEYERFEDGTIPVRTGRKIPDPTFVPPAPPPGTILGQHPSPPPPMIDETRPVANVVAEKYSATRISPGHLLIPVEFTGRDYARESDWLAYQTYVAVHEAQRRKWAIPEDLKTSGVDDDDRLVELDRKGSREHQLKVTIVFCYAQRIYPNVAHPDTIRRLIFVEGMKEPVEVRDRYHQKFDERGRFVMGIKTLPIKVLTTRYVPDYWCPPSDCAMSARQSDELSEGRTQMVLQRKRAVPLRQINIQAVADERVKDLITKAEWSGEPIPANSNDPIVTEIAPPAFPRERFQFDGIVKGDVDRLWSLGAAPTPTGVTATEISDIRQAVENRLSGEGQAVTQYWLDIMEHNAALVQLYADREDYVEIAGEAGATAIEAWTRETVRGEFLYDIVPESAAKPDAAYERELALNFYNLALNNPSSNKEEMLRWIADKYAVDEPDRFVAPPPPPQPKPPDPPRLSIAVKGENLNPAAPEYPNVMALIQALGVQAQLAPPEPEPIGPAQVVDRERLRMAESDERDGRTGGFAGSQQTRA